jgi:hypothetical protein
MCFYCSFFREVHIYNYLVGIIKRRLYDQNRRIRRRKMQSQEV